MLSHRIETPITVLYGKKYRIFGRILGFGILLGWMCLDFFLDLGGVIFGGCLEGFCIVFTTVLEVWGEVF